MQSSNLDRTKIANIQSAMCKELSNTELETNMKVT